MSTRNKIIEAIENGNSTTSEIANDIDKERSHAARVLKSMSEEGVLTREKRGRSYHYDVVEKNDSNHLE